MKKNVLKRGFTLIELLVVIAIIGILSTVVLASLSPARIKSKEAASIMAVRQISSQMELHYDGLTGYTGGCDDQEVINLIEGAEDQFGNTAVGIDDDSECHAEGESYAVSVMIESANIDSICIDTNGSLNQDEEAVGSSGSTPAMCVE